MNKELSGNGNFDVEYGAILQARMGSGRLPGKSMRLLAGEPLLKRVIDRIKLSKKLDKIILATTVRQQDDVLEELAKSLGIACFRGSEDHVLERVVLAAEKYKVKHIVELHGDNPFLDPEIIDNAIEEYAHSDCDYISNTLERTFPGGLRVQVFPAEELRRIYKTVHDPAVIEHVSLYFYEDPNRYNIKNLAAPKPINRPEIRLTIDTPADFELASTLYSLLVEKGLVPNFSTQQVIELIDQNQLSKINDSIKSKPIRDSLPDVTIYITNYNYGAYLEQSIQSVLNQTFQNFELIIIDDGSTDQSHEIIKKYEGTPKVYSIFQQNQGLNKTNNIALKLAQSKYIMRLDADDYLDHRALEIMINQLNKNPELALVFPDYYEVDAEGQILKQIKRHDFSTEEMLKDSPAHGACTMFRKAILEKVGGYDETFRCQDGYDIWLKIFDTFKVENISLPLFFYRQHNSNLTKNEVRLLHTRAEIKKKQVALKKLPKIKTLAVIPVRGHQFDPRSLPLATLGKKRLIDWSIEAALKSELVSEVVVSTPSDEVVTYLAEAYGDKIIIHSRSKDAARINTETSQTLQDVLAAYSPKIGLPDAILTLFIEAPFRTSLYIDKAINTLLLYDVDVVNAVRLDSDIFFKHDGQGLHPLNYDRKLRLERDNIYRRVGGLSLMTRKFFERDHSLLGGKIGHIIVDEMAAFTIKSELDWDIANFLAAKQEVL